MDFLIGIDEAGRGPLAGPVAVGVVAVARGFDVASEFPGVADSKKLSEKKREAVFAMLEARAGQGDLRYRVEFEEAQAIDREGIAVVIRRAVSRGVNALAPDAALAHVFLDGGLKAPPEYRQETIIGGDESVPLISLASIAAKVARDRLMVGFAKEYPLYGFDVHKGYGTKAHFEALKKHGLCVMHRRSFIHLASAG
jgi:ribonuclease HII